MRAALPLLPDLPTALPAQAARRALRVSARERHGHAGAALLGGEGLLQHPALQRLGVRRSVSPPTLSLDRFYPDFIRTFSQHHPHFILSLHLQTLTSKIFDDNISK